MNKLNLTIKFTSLQALIQLTDKLHIHSLKTVGLKNEFTTYLPYILSQSIIECVRQVKPDLQKRRLVKYTKNIAIGIGVITSIATTVTYNGSDYIINFTLNLLKTTASTLIIDKLNNLKVDGVSVAILINFILSIPSVLIGLSTQPLLSGLLFIASIGVMAYGNYKLLQSTEDVNMHYKDTKDKFSLSTRNTYTTSLIMSSFITSIVSNNPLIQGGLLLIINPLVQWFLSTSTDVEELNKSLQINNIYLTNINHGKDTKDCLNQMIKRNSIKLGLVGAIVFIFSSLLIKIFAISISPIMLSVVVNSFINVSFSGKALIKSNNLSNLNRVRGFAR